MSLNRATRHLAAALTLSSLAALVGCSDDPAPPVLESYPVVALGDNSCVRVEVEHEDLATWITASEDFVFGTISAVTPVWDENFDAAGDIVYGPCATGFPALDVTLNDVRSLKNGREFNSVVLRIGGETLRVWSDAGVHFDASQGASQASWQLRGEAQQPLVVGTSLGGAFYKINDKNVMISHLEPLLSIDEKNRVLVQPFTHAWCEHVGLTVTEVAAGINGIDYDKLEARIDAIAYVDFPANEPEAYRAHLGLDNFLTAEPHFGGLCTSVPANGGDDGDDGDGGDGGDGGDDGDGGA